MENENIDFLSIISDYDFYADRTMDAGYYSDPISPASPESCASGKH